RALPAPKRSALRRRPVGAPEESRRRQRRAAAAKARLRRRWARRLRGRIFVARRMDRGLRRSFFFRGAHTKGLRRLSGVARGPPEAPLARASPAGYVCPPHERHWPYDSTLSSSARKKDSSRG